MLVLDFLETNTGILLQSLSKLSHNDNKTSIRSLVMWNFLLSSQQIMSLLLHFERFFHSTISVYKFKYERSAVCDYDHLYWRDCPELL
jgi:hypothetical protein